MPIDTTSHMTQSKARTVRRYPVRVRPTFVRIVRPPSAS